MNILVCASTARELAALAPAIFPDAGAIPEMTPVKKDGKRGELVFLNTGVGPLNAALAIGLALGPAFMGEERRAGVDAIICAGTAGAYDLEKNPLCSLWRVGEEIWPEYGLNDGSTVTARAFSFPLWKKAGEEIYDRAPLADARFILGKAAAPDKPWPACRSLTVAGVSASFARRQQLFDKYHAELENMEGFAAAYAALRAGIPCLEVRAVANKIGPRSKNEKDFEGALLALGKVLPELSLL